MKFFIILILCIVSTHNSKGQLFERVNRKPAVLSRSPTYLSWFANGAGANVQVRFIPTKRIRVTGVYAAAVDGAVGGQAINCFADLAQINPVSPFTASSLSITLTGGATQGYSGLSINFGPSSEMMAVDWILETGIEYEFIAQSFIGGAVTVRGVLRVEELDY